jgi:hypothetical protein
MVSKEQAIDKLTSQLNAMRSLEHAPASSPEFMKWERDTKVVIERIFGKKGHQICEFRGISYSANMIRETWPVRRNYEAEDQKAYVEGLNRAKALLESLIQEIKDFGQDKSSSRAEPLAMDILVSLCNKFHLVARQLRSRHGDRSTLNIEDEYDVQDLTHALLTLFFDDIRAEEWTPSYAGASARMDFLLKEEKVVIETKKTRKGLEAKQVGEQLIVDIEKYRVHPDCKTLVCFVYDPEGRIGNPRGLEGDLSREEDGFEVKVLIRPSGV